MKGFQKFLIQGVCPAVAVLSVLAFSVPNHKQNRDDQKPNIILIMADDLTMYDIEPFGSKQVHTPNLKRLAGEGVCLDNMFNMVPVCSPTRQSLLTGLGPVRNGAYPNHTMIYNGIKTLPTYLQALGYRTAIIGKKHYAPESAYPFEFLGGRDGDNGQGQDVDLSKAEDYIKKSADKPYFLMFASNQPHEPWNRGNQQAYNPEEIKLNPNMVDTKLTRKQMAKYFAEITYLDSLVGVCLDIVERSGDKENTVIMFATEQGNSFPFSKWTLYDQGLRSGFIVRWPGKIKPGTRNPAMLQYADITPTMIDLAGGDPKKINTGSKDGNGNTGFDGSSFKKVLTGETNHQRDFVFAEHTTRGIIRGSDAYAMRSVRSAHFLYIENLNSESLFKNTVTNGPLFQSWMTENPVRAAAYQKRPKEELYDVIKDPFNLHNLAADPRFKSVKSELSSKLLAFMKQQNDKGLATEMDALNRQPKHQQKD
ncbi:sulfatase family protein [Pedobacter endophyticus]|uniref:Sulfatase n=1 Tax=Pedobacter endophyticus TaxID=2789740 RepID=A0A7S9L1S3_9SPHI|nr:sulfatase [Pedobacter endophyticus]QPH40904.1 sulfatase [Pedobacter endophyticus]